MEIKINLKEDIQKQFENKGLCYPKKKSNGSYGLSGSTLLDRLTLKESEKAVLNYLKERGIIEIN